MNEYFYFEVFLSGTPLGFSFIGKEKDGEFLQKFYTTTGDKEKEFLQIERKNNDIYYSFVVCGIANNESRDGGLFNLTLKITNGYFVDVCLLYNKMSDIYNKHILNNIIRNDEYVIDNFTKQTELRKRIETLFYNLIRDNKNYISPLMEIAIARNNNSYKCNPIDISIDLNKELLQNYGLIKVSSEYNTKDTKLKKLKALKNKEISEMKKQHDKHCKQLESKTTVLENDVEKYQQRIQQNENLLKDINEKLDNISKTIFNNDENSNNKANKTNQGMGQDNSNDSKKNGSNTDDKSDSRKVMFHHTNKKQNLLIYCIIIFCIILLFQVEKLSSNIKELKLSINNIENTYNNDEQPLSTVDTTSYIKDSTSTKTEPKQDSTISDNKADSSNVDTAQEQNMDETNNEDNKETKSTTFFKQIDVVLIIGIIIIIVGIVILWFKAYKK